MPPKRSAAAAALGGGGPGAASPFPKRVKLSTEPAAGTQRTLDAFFTSHTTPTSHAASPLSRNGGNGGNVSERPHSQPRPRPQEVIVVDDDEEGEHQVSTCRPSGHRNDERRPAAGNGNGNASDCDCDGDCDGGADRSIVHTTQTQTQTPMPMTEEDRFGVRLDEENGGENGVDTDLLLARHLARAERVDVELARKRESHFNTGTSSLDGQGPGSPSNASNASRRNTVIPLNIPASSGSPRARPVRRQPAVAVAPPPPLSDFAPAGFPDLTTDPLLFRPCTAPDNDNDNDNDGTPAQAWWPPRTPAPYALLAHTLHTLAATRSRIAILAALTNALRVLIIHDPPAVLPALYLLSNCLGPPWERIELGVGGSILSKTLQRTTSLTPAAMRTLYKQYGDPGDVAYHAVVGTGSSTASPSKARTSVLKPHPRLLIKPLYEDLLKVARAAGPGSQKTRQAVIERLILCAVGAGWGTQYTAQKHKDVNAHLRGEEARFLVRTLAQNLRVGAVRTTVLSALARASALSATPEDIGGPHAGDLVVTEDELEAIRCAGPVVARGARRKADGDDNDQDHADGEVLRARVTQRLLQAEALVKRVYAQHPSYDDIVAVVLSKGLAGLRTATRPDPASGLRGVGLTLGTPLIPTLGSPMRSLDDVYDRLGSAAHWTAEMKYDGQRAQVHAWKEGSSSEVNVRVFSRHLEDMTDKYPDIIHLFHLAFARDATISSVIVDSEVVAVNYQTGELGTFQELAGRARRDVKAADVKVAVCVFLFDLMLLNDQVLIQQPFRARRRLLRSTLPPLDPAAAAAAAAAATDNHFTSDLGAAALLHARMDHVESVENAAGREAVEEFWEKAVESKCEGLMIKLLDSTEVNSDIDAADAGEDADEGEVASPSKARRRRKQGVVDGTYAKRQKKPLPATYEPDKRTSAWLKLKKDYVEGVGDSLDLVPVGAWHGMGRKAAWWSPILLGVWDAQRERFVAMCKCMSGFTDAFYKALSERYAVGSETCSTTAEWNVDTGGYHPSVYFRPSEVWEIRGADLTMSPTSVAAQGYVAQDRTKGISLRFPRFIRLRHDKHIHHASDPALIANLWLLQQHKGGHAHRGRGADDGQLLDYVEEEEEVEEDDDL